MLTIAGAVLAASLMFTFGAVVNQGARGPTGPAAPEPGPAPTLTGPDSDTSGATGIPTPASPTRPLSTRVDDYASARINRGDVTSLKGQHATMGLAGLRPSATQLTSRQGFRS